MQKKNGPTQSQFRILLVRTMSTGPRHDVNFLVLKGLSVFVAGRYYIVYEGTNHGVYWNGDGSGKNGRYRPQQHLGKGFDRASLLTVHHQYPGQPKQESCH